MSLFPETWKFSEAREICSQIVDCVNKTAPVVDYETPYKMIRTTNVKKGRVDLSGARCVDEATFVKWNRRLTPRKGDVVLTREAPLGDVGLIRTDDKVFLGQRTMIFRADQVSLGQRFLYYSLLGPTLQAQISALGSGSTVEHVRVPDAEKLVIPHPPITEQRKIAAFLSAYDDLIENNKRRITLLENMAEEIYREWFVRFRFPGWQAAEFEKGYPESWRVLKFDEFCKLKRGYDLPDSKVMDGPYPVLASTSVKTFHSEYKVKAPVITTGRSGSLGTVLFKRENCWPLNTTLYVQSFKGNSPFFIYFTMKNMPLETFNSGAGVPSLNRNHLAGLRVVVPDETAQKAFDNIVEPIFRQVDTLQEQSEQLQKTKNQLLPRLISGKLSVENLGIEFPPSMQSDSSGSADEAAA